MLKPIFIITCLFCSTFLLSQEQEAFILCEGRTYPYYHPELKYAGDFWAIKQHFQSGYPLSKFQKVKSNSGIISIQFKVNCEGETGSFSLQQCDLNYQPTILNKEILDYFLSKTKVLTDWIPAMNEEGNIVNSHKFFSFRINKGILLEILPK